MVLIYSNCNYNSSVILYTVNEADFYHKSVIPILHSVRLLIKRPREMSVEVVGSQGWMCVILPLAGISLLSWHCDNTVF